MFQDCRRPAAAGPLQRRLDTVLFDVNGPSGRHGRPGRAAGPERGAGAVAADGPAHGGRMPAGWWPAPRGGPRDAGGDRFRRHLGLHLAPAPTGLRPGMAHRLPALRPVEPGPGPGLTSPRHPRRTRRPRRPGRVALRDRLERAGQMGAADRTESDRPRPRTHRRAPPPGPHRRRGRPPAEAAPAVIPKIRRGSRTYGLPAH